jgi:hypothetical protein
MLQFNPVLDEFSEQSDSASAQRPTTTAACMARVLAVFR